MENVNQEEVQAAAEEEAAFLGVTGANAVDNAIEIVPETETEPETEPEIPAEEVVTPPPALTMDDIRAAVEAAKAETKAEFAKLRDGLNGKVGGLQKKLESLNRAGGISIKAKERLATEFPELAELLFDGSEVAQETPVPVVTTPQQPVINVDEVVQTRLTEATRTFEAKLLKRDHPDYEKVVALDDFAAWRATLPAETNAELDSSWDADFISGKLTEFKTWYGAQQVKAQKQQQKQERLAAAVLPTGIPRNAQATGTEDEEEAAMNQAFNLRKRL